ncbi:MFS transporter [Sphingomonas sp.]|uniref:MFS transporter n=1 Tax=Sphingomonas sp. TaxID=28214 RepID=UPI002D7EB9A0|nr:MFS transporter [Sphingomonas sp.]HEU0043947.1 MFS transporter [Sphingomonas sp.]
MTPFVSPSRAWLLFGLLCVAGVFNAMDRPIIAILKPDMSADFGWTDADFGRLAAVTQFAAALSFLLTGWLVDRLGVRRAMIVGVSAWSLAALLHGWARTGSQVVAARIGLGATEAVQTPLTIKTVATLFAPNRRSLAIGIGTALASAGTISMPFFIPPMAAAFGWRGALAFAGLAGFIVLALWLLAARGVRFDAADEDARSETPAATEIWPIRRILAQRATWAILGAKALSDATWWLLNFWLPDFYRREFDLTTTQLAIPLAIAFAGSALGALAAGSISTRLLERGVPVDRVRKGMLIVSALVVLPVPVVLALDSFWPVAVMMGVVLAGHQGFSLTLFSIITDVFPRAAIGRVTALGAFCGNIGGMAIVWITGVTLTAGIGYMPLFSFAAVSYLLAFAWLRLLLPRIVRAAE